MPRQSRKAEESPFRLHRGCCYKGGIILGAVLLVIGVIVLPATCVRGIGGNSFVWDPQIRHYSRILGAVASVAGVLLLFICQQWHSLRSRQQSVRSEYRRFTQDISDATRTKPSGTGDGEPVLPILVCARGSEEPLLAPRGAASDQSVLSHHMTIESWLKSLPKDRDGKHVTTDVSFEMVGAGNFCTNNSNLVLLSDEAGKRHVEVFNALFFTRLLDSVLWEQVFNCPELQTTSFATEQSIYRNPNTEVCHLQQQHNTTSSHHHFSQPKDQEPMFPVYTCTLPSFSGSTSELDVICKDFPGIYGQSPPEKSHEKQENGRWSEMSFSEETIPIGSTPSPTSRTDGVEAGDATCFPAAPADSAAAHRPSSPIPWQAQLPNTAVQDPTALGDCSPGRRQVESPASDNFGQTSSIMSVPLTREELLSACENIYDAATRRATSATEKASVFTPEVATLGLRQEAHSPPFSEFPKETKKFVAETAMCDFLPESATLSTASEPQMFHCPVLLDYGSADPRPANSFLGSAAAAVHFRQAINSSCNSNGSLTDTDAGSPLEVKTSNIDLLTNNFNSNNINRNNNIHVQASKSDTSCFPPPFEDVLKASASYSGSPRSCKSDFGQVWQNPVAVSSQETVWFSSDSLVKADPVTEEETDQLSLKSVVDSDDPYQEELSTSTPEMID